MEYRCPPIGTDPNPIPQKYDHEHAPCRNTSLSAATILATSQHSQSTQALTPRPIWLTGTQSTSGPFSSTRSRKFVRRLIPRYLCWRAGSRRCTTASAPHRPQGAAIASDITSKWMESPAPPSASTAASNGTWCPNQLRVGNVASAGHASTTPRLLSWSEDTNPCDSAGEADDMDDDLQWMIDMDDDSWEKLMTSGQNPLSPRSLSDSW